LTIKNNAYFFSFGFGFAISHRQRGGDILTAIDGKPFNTHDQLTLYLEDNKRVGETVTLSLLRNGKPLALSAVLLAR
jgi:S1-C subfamily serine protease